MSSEIVRSWAARAGPRSAKNASSGVFALAGPHHVPGGVVDHDGQVVVTFLPRDLVDADVAQPVEPIGVHAVGHHPGDDRADGGPGDAQQPAHRGLVGLGRQPGDGVFEVTGEPRPMPSERDLFDNDAVGGARQPT